MATARGGARAAESTPAKRAPGATKPAPAKKAAAKKTAARAPDAKSQAKRTAAKEPAPKKAAAKRAPAEKAASAKKAPARKAAPKTVRAAGSAPRYVVRPDEKPWTAAELAAVRAQLDADLVELVEQIADTEEGIADLLRDSGDGAGDDQADAGTKAFEREQEMSLANNARELVAQNQRALARLDDGTYGVCENCGNPIGKARLQAFPRATLCMSCKQAEERT